jgi:hypothetical protein
VDLRIDGVWSSRWLGGLAALALSVWYYYKRAAKQMVREGGAKNQARQQLFKDHFGAFFTSFPSSLQVLVSLQ